MLVVLLAQLGLRVPPELPGLLVPQVRPAQPGLRELPDLPALPGLLVLLEPRDPLDPPARLVQPALQVQLAPLGLRVLPVPLARRVLRG